MQGFCDGETSILAWARGVLVCYYGDRHLVHLMSCKHYCIEKLTGIGAPTFVQSIKSINSKVCKLQANSANFPNNPRIVTIH